MPRTPGGRECSSLREYTGSLTAIPKRTTISDKEIKVKLTSGRGAAIRITNRNVTLSGDCILVQGGELTGPVITIEHGGSGFTMRGSTLRAQNPIGASFEQAIRNEGGAGRGTLGDDRIEDCGECMHGNFELARSFVIANERLGAAGGPHREAWYLNNGTAVARDDTIFVPEDQTAVIFDNVANGVPGSEACSNHITLERSFVAGSGQMLQTCGPRALGAGTATLTVKGNRFARCLTKPVLDKRCAGPGFEGADSHGYFPNGGWIGVLGERPWGTLVWNDNFWDDDLKRVVSPAANRP